MFSPRILICPDYKFEITDFPSQSYFKFLYDYSAGGEKILESESLNMTQAGSETTCNE